MTTMELEWEDPPVSDGPFFTRDLFDKYSLAPNVRELWACLQSPVDGANTEQAEAPSSSLQQEAVELKDTSISSRASCWESCDTDDPCVENDAEGTEDAKGSRNTWSMESEVDVLFPEPRLPYPCFSNLSSQEQKKYVSFLLSSKSRGPPWNLKELVDNEVMQFLRYLQDVSQKCADDYYFIMQGATQYSEDYFRECLEQIKTLPQLYQIHEMTSLTGGKFNPGLSLTFEKQLLFLGNVNITDHKIVPADAQLATDYQSVSSENPPAKKAKEMHATISSDGNAEKLCACYQPHVCLTRDALVRLLDNHGPDFREQWELPVTIKLTPGAGKSQKKTIYIDSPLLKTEMTVRERSHVFHEESLKLSVKKNGRKKVFFLMTELPEIEQQISLESSRRSCASLEEIGLDSDVDLIDLETFGDTSTKTPKEKKPDGRVKASEVIRSPVSTKKIKSNEQLVEESSSSQKESESHLLNLKDSKTEQIQLEVNATKTREDSAQENEEHLASGGSDDEKLVIDDSAAPARKAKCNPSASAAPASGSVAEDSVSSPPPKGRRRSKRGNVSGDQLSEILRMQTAMFKSSPEKSSPKSPARHVELSPPSHAAALVKPCVSAYLERHADEDASAVRQQPSLVHANTPGRKKILSRDLQASAENEEDYEAPAEGNLLYKLYSLQDLLLMVRSSVSLMHRKNMGGKQNQFIPVHLLPKLEYQLSYGVESLTSSEACQLWTETLLHSSTDSYIAHINAHTSNVALLRKLPGNWKQNLNCGFKPSKSLNILHHLLKKLSGLEEGQYLIAHKAGEPFVTLLKAALGRATRGLYNLQQVHGGVPLAPPLGPVPWVPLDPDVLMDFHRIHERVPCTFPPKSLLKRGGRVGTVQKKRKGHNSKARKRSAKRDDYITNLIQKSV